MDASTHPLHQDSASVQVKHGPCPAWCTAGTDEDPQHRGDYIGVPLSMAGPEESGDLCVRLEQGFEGTGAGPYVAIVHNDRYDLDMTLAEAADLAETLAALLEEAAEAQAGPSAPALPGDDR